MANDLPELNAVLFDTLRGLNNGSIEESKAKAIVKVTDGIAKVAKIQLDAFKMTGGASPVPAVLGNEMKIHPQIGSPDRHTQMTQFAVKLGYKNVTTAIRDMGKGEFDKQFKESQSK
ncbi:hypothetical protein [Aquimarina macrocephali]|uniref:hypothetical protein n=1 Tax=Aquimarina macrocephali TaxID=666563 RepID=UPI003F665280